MLGNHFNTTMILIILNINMLDDGAQRRILRDFSLRTMIINSMVLTQDLVLSDSISLLRSP